MIWDMWKKGFDAWEQATAQYMEKVMKNPVVLGPAGAMLTAAMKTKAATDRAMAPWWAALGLPTRRDQERALHKLNQLESRLFDLEEQLAAQLDEQAELAMDVTPFLAIQPAPRAVFDRLATHRHRARFHVRDGGAWQPVTWGEFATQIRGVARWLVEHELEAGRARRDLRAELGRVGERGARRPDRRRGVRADLPGVDRRAGRVRPRARRGPLRVRRRREPIARLEKARAHACAQPADVDRSRRARRGPPRRARDRGDDDSIRAACRRATPPRRRWSTRGSARSSSISRRRCSTRAARRATRRACRSRTATSARNGADWLALQRAAPRRGRPRPALAADEPHLRLRRAVPRQHARLGDLPRDAGRRARPAARASRRRCS